MIFEFLLAAIIIELTPGPNMTWIALLGASRGRGVALTAVMGIALGLIVAGVASAFGVSAIISNTPFLFQSLRFAGAAYLIYLAWDSLRFANSASPQSFNFSSLRYFYHGLITNILNPKAYLFFATIIPQFTIAQKPIMQQLIMLSAIYIFIATSVHLVIAVLSGKFSKFFERPRRREILGKVFAALLVLVSIWFLYVTKV